MSCGATLKVSELPRLLSSLSNFLKVEAGAEVWVFEKRLPGCCVWECELLLTAKKLSEASGAACSQKAKAAPRKPDPFIVIGSEDLIDSIL